MWRWWSSGFWYLTDSSGNAIVPEKNTVSIFRAEVRFEGFTALRMMTFFWVLAPCRLVSWCQCFAQTYCLHLRAEDEESMFLWNFSIHRQIQTIPKPRTSSSSSSQRWNPQISHKCEEVTANACKETQRPPNSETTVNSNQVFAATEYVFTHVDKYQSFGRTYYLHLQG
jgi:hypothetical protein